MKLPPVYTTSEPTIRPITASLIAALCATPALANGHWPSPTATVTPHATGLHVAWVDGATLDGLPFGSPFHSTMHRLVAIFGHDATVTFPQDCGEGPLMTVTIPGEIGLMFQDDRLAGWNLTAGNALSTARGLSVGSD